MRYALLSDIHGNLSALMSVLRDAHQRGGFDQVWCIGDIVGYGPDPNECIELLRDYDHLCVAGNHDWCAIAKADIAEFNPDAAIACQWTGKQLDITSREYLSALPLSLVAGEFTLVHGSLRDPIWEYLTTATVAQRNADRLKTQYCIVGHTHIPLKFECDDHGCSETTLLGEVALKSDNKGKLFINPGSVGQPRDGDPRASYAIYDSDAGTLRHYRVKYNIAATQRKMEELGLPLLLIDRLSYGR